MQKLPVTNPYTLSQIGEIELLEWSVINHCITAAKELEKPKRILPPHERIKILENFVGKLKSQFDEIVNTAVEEGGKPISDTQVEVQRAINGVQLAISEISQISGKEIPMGLNSASYEKLAFTIKEPIGLVVAISAFNHPVNLIIHQVVTAIAAGCPVIVKPALTTPLSAKLLVELLSKSGLPKNYCQFITCSDENAEKLATDSRVQFLSFIGSSKVGWLLRSKIAPGTRIALEHGGIAPLLIDRNQNVKKIAPSIIQGGFYHSGQVCVSIQRLFIHEDELEEYLKTLTTLTKQIKYGNPKDSKTLVGPLIKPQEVTRVDNWVKNAIVEGATLVCGGRIISESLYEPTLLLNPPSTSKVSTHEIFGPVICIYSYSDKEKAIEEMNNTRMHFQAGVFTNDLSFAMNASKTINANTVLINNHTAFRVDWMPFGGRDDSGLGMGGIKYTINDLLRDKLIVFNEL